ncbi:MAG: MBL fold metallo-hydrolase [Anaerolineae bacterium]
MISSPVRLELPTDFAVGSVNAYLFTGPEPVLVDCGVRSEAGWAAIQAGLADCGVAVSDLARVVITHAHVDHYGLAAKIAAHSDAEIWVSELGVPWLVDSDAMWEKRIGYYQDEFLPHIGLPSAVIETTVQFMWFASRTADSVLPGRIVTFPLDATLEMGGLPWQVIYTPGHASHQTCFYQPDTRQFLSADMLLVKAPTPVVERPTSDTKRTPGLPQFLDSLSLVESLSIDDVYPGHGKPFRDHLAVIKQQRARILRRKLECLAWVQKGVDTIGALVQKMYGGQPDVLHVAGLWMLVGYLDLLLADGLIRERSVDGNAHFEPVNGRHSSGSLWLRSL